MTAILQSNYVGGTERAFLHLLGGIPRDEYEVAIGLDDTMLASDFAREVAMHECAIIPFRDVVSKRDWQGMRDTVNRIRRFRPDIIHIHLNHPLANPFLAFAAKAAGVRRIVLTEQLNILLEQQVFGRARVRLYCRLADTVVAVSQDVRQGLTGYYGVAGANIIVIENAIDAQRIAAEVGSADRGALRQQLGFSPEVFLIGCVAVLRQQKGQLFLVDAMPAVLAAVPNARLVLIGDGEGRQEIEERVQALGLVDAVHFLGWRADATKLLAALDAFVLPSLYEGLPLALLEAMAAGLPIVATNVDGTRDAVENRVSGILIESMNAPALASAIVEVAGNPPLARALAQAALQRVRTMYDVLVMRRRYLELYEQLLGQ